MVWGRRERLPVSSTSWSNNIASPANVCVQGFGNAIENILLGFQTMLKAVLNGHNYGNIYYITCTQCYSEHASLMRVQDACSVVMRVLKFKTPIL